MFFFCKSLGLSSCYILDRTAPLRFSQNRDQACGIGPFHRTVWGNCRTIYRLPQSAASLPLFAVSTQQARQAKPFSAGREHRRLPGINVKSDGVLSIYAPVVVEGICKPAVGRRQGLLVSCLNLADKKLYKKLCGGMLIKFTTSVRERGLVGSGVA